jgi:hypothetical protein
MTEQLGEATFLSRFDVPTPASAEWLEGDVTREVSGVG